MSDWSTPIASTAYLDVLSDLKDRDVDAASLAESPTNPPTNYIRYNRSLNKLQTWNGSAWVDLVLSLAGGGTGSSTAAGARTALGLGTMATQNDSAVNITGGTISGVNISAGAITSGTLPLVRGGTGASLSLGATGEVLLSNGSSVVFSSGASIANLNASNLTSGAVPSARITSFALSGGTGSLPSGALSGGTFSGTITFSGAFNVSGAVTFSSTLAVTSTITASAGVSIGGALSVGTSAVVGTTLVVGSTFQANGVATFQSGVGIVGLLSAAGGMNIPSDYLLNFNSATIFPSATSGSQGFTAWDGYIGILVNGTQYKLPIFLP